jgi:hypothetical protein
MLSQDLQVMSLSSFFPLRPLMKPMNLQIYIMDADGSNQTNLTNNPATDYYSVWVP